MENCCNLILDVHMVDVGFDEFCRRQFSAKMALDHRSIGASSESPHAFGIGKKDLIVGHLLVAGFLFVVSERLMTARWGHVDVQRIHSNQRKKVKLKK